MTRELTHAERQVLNAIQTAAEKGEQCPLNLDLEMLTGYNSASMGPKLVARLEEKGFIIVERYQRFRRVMICETGKWTAVSPSQRSLRKHVARGAGSASGALAKKARRM